MIFILEIFPEVKIIDMMNFFCCGLKNFAKNKNFFIFW